MADINSTGWRVDDGWEPRVLLCSVAEGTPHYVEDEWERSHHAMAAHSMRVIRDVTEDTYHRMRGMIAPFWAADINSVVYDRLKEGIEKIIAETERDKVGTNKG